MRENATLHFDLSHLAPDQPFTLHAGVNRHPLQRHTPQTLTRARRDNPALRLVADHRVTHFAQPAQLPDALLMLRVTAPKLDPDDPLDRLVLVSFHLPRRHRVAALRARRRRRRGAPVPPPRKLVAALKPGVELDDEIPDDHLLKIGDYNTAYDCAAALVFHHGELMTLNENAGDILTNIIDDALGMEPLAQGILDEAQANEADPAHEPNWVNPVPGLDWTTTGKPSKPIYVWSDKTQLHLVQPLQDSLEQSKDDTQLELQCWRVLPGVTQVPLPLAPPATASAEAEATYTVTPAGPQGGVSQSFDFVPSTKRATVSLGNTLLRWLQVSVDQYGPGGEPVGTTTGLGVLSPPDTVMAVPLPTDPTDFGFDFDEKASRAVVTLGGLGQGPSSWSYDGVGIGCTILFNYAVPTMFVALGVAVDQTEDWSAVTKQVVPIVVSAVEAATGGPLAGLVAGGAVDGRSIALMISNVTGSLLVSVLTSSDALAAYLVEAGIFEAAEAAEPFVGWAALAIGATADTAAMLETTVAVSTNPAHMTLQIDRVVDVAVTVKNDPGDPGHWPATATHYFVSITYTDGPVYAFDAPFDPHEQGSTSITHTFTGLPAGGSFTVLATFVAKTGWVAGSGTSPAQTIPPDASTVEVPAFAIVESLVPLTSTTAYTFDEKLTYGPSGRTWSQPPAVPAPTATVSSLDLSNVGNVIGSLGQITLNESLSVLGYSWQAAGQGVPLKGTGTIPYSGQEHTFQAVSTISNTPGAAVAFCQQGYIAPACIAFPPPTMPKSPADGFILEPADTTRTVMYLRGLHLTGGGALVPGTGSFGRFGGFQDDLVIHPAGYAVALSRATSKLQIVRLAGAAMADDETPQALIMAGRGTRCGLLHDPLAVSCSLGRIVVLDVTDDAPQGLLVAFDKHGNPGHCFADDATTAPLRTEGTATVTLVDLAVEATGYTFVLKYLTPTSGAVTADDYRLDVYKPDGSFVVQVGGLAAAALHVDLWRNLYTLNYEIVAGSGRTEPSVSRWIPSPPDRPGPVRLRPGGPPVRGRGRSDDRRGGHR